MNKNSLKLTAVISFLITFTFIFVWLFRSVPVEGRAQPTTVNNNATHPFFLLNETAKATTGTEPEALRQLTEQVFATFALSELPVFTTESIKERVNHAELNYRQRQHKGIPETFVAKTVNALAEEFAIPEYSKITPAMVRTVRVNLMIPLPNFIAQDSPGAKKRDKPIGGSINPFMSPLEATAVTMFILQQKITNESFQVSHKDFYDALHKKRMEEWGRQRAVRDGTAAVQPEETPHQGLRVVHTSKAENARRAIKSAAEAMDPNTLLNLADSSLDMLGIAREGGLK